MSTPTVEVIRPKLLFETFSAGISKLTEIVAELPGIGEVQGFATVAGAIAGVLEGLERLS